MAEAHGHGHDSGHGEASHGIGHLAPTKILVGTGVALLILTGLTVWSAGIDLGEANIYVALGIALVKATLVGLFFMHLRWDRPFNSVIFVASIALVSLFLALAMTDTAEYKPTMHPGDAPQVLTTIQSAQPAAP